MRVAILISVAAMAACTAASKDPTWSQARLAPARWIQDFDYKTDLAAYLRRQHESARLQGATAYVYFYSDSDAHCLGTRRMMSRPEVTSILENVRITMLNADRLKWLHDRSDGSVFDPGDWVPVIAKIAANGTLETEIFLPDVALYHTDPSKIHRNAMVTGRDSRDINRQFVEELRRFFQSHNEI